FPRMAFLRVVCGPAMKVFSLSFFLIVALTLPRSFAADEKSLGYQDTPIIPGTKWHVHDGTRPQPKVVTPGEPSTQEKAGTAPSDAIVLFDGKDLSKWKSLKTPGDAAWKVEGGYFESNKTGDVATKD